MTANTDNFLQDPNPFNILTQWMNEAANCGLKESTAMTLATVSSQGHPSTRVVLLKEIRPDGVVFYTNYLSHKGKDLEGQPWAAATLYWDPLFRQINLKGRTEKLPRSESQSYWKLRARESQISQTASKQSQPVDSRATLDTAYDTVEQKFADQEIPCPDHWGGYLLKVEDFEFWIGRPHRFHDRFHYWLDQGLWKNERLYP
ncbi:MAG: pyridoxamine 5'-phosphate oxidase [Pseudobdellovibrionaceae bacterium]|nr:pyridoxamine 5'-phosphate oxidase [Bdellovibrionales bacterium]USN48449.1 MAG: pyridoxamine 5'-phosphate oxidase [Pseudobdellovibrionaceae bacterium]